MEYEKIYSSFYLKLDDSRFYKLPQEVAYKKMKSWLHTIASLPYVRNCFSSLTFDDVSTTLIYSLVNSVDTSSDDEFVIELFAQGMAICWMTPEIDNAKNLATVVGGKEEKTILNNYKNNIARLNTLKIQHKKLVRDHGYFNGLNNEG